MGCFPSVFLYVILFQFSDFNTHQQAFFPYVISVLLNKKKGADIVQGMLDKAEAKGCEAGKGTHARWFQFVAFYPRSLEVT